MARATGKYLKWQFELAISGKRRRLREAELEEEESGATAHQQRGRAVQSGRTGERGGLV
jgi:hypothetical protein